MQKCFEGDAGNATTAAASPPPWKAAHYCASCGLCREVCPMPCGAPQPPMSLDFLESARFLDTCTHLSRRPASCTGEQHSSKQSSSLSPNTTSVLAQQPPSFRTLLPKSASLSTRLLWRHRLQVSATTCRRRFARCRYCLTLAEAVSQPGGSAGRRHAVNARRDC